ncbi:hypothetical protein GTP46_06350 [Duganella sp. FT135W]|uniref:Flagellar protein FlaG n=1 Tax=Duganella flavida TaxID=2692175 RepID=A0A6L8KCU6_9BURK|nr:flagellar protein FlaG [Duganella flavida]MYM22261.1 hypothetical protein [Duganella flavida]
MDTSSISRLDLLPASAMPTSGKSGGTTTPALGIVASKDAPAARTPSKTELRNSVDALNQHVDNDEVHFSIDEDSGLSVVKVIDTETKKVLHQFPSEQSLEIGKNLNSPNKGLLINSEA